MTSRLEDLLATAERQLAARSYDAAIDTYRTALGEPDTAEAGVAELLAKATRTRDAARGVVRAVAPAVAVEAPPPAPEPATPVVSPPVPPAPRIVEDEPIEPPTFQLLETDRSEYAGERDADLRLDVEKLSIIDPSPPPESPDQQLMVRLIVAAAIALAVIVVTVLLK